MKKLLTISALLFVFVSVIYCSNDNSVNNQDELLGTWELVQFQNLTTTITMDDLDNFGPIVITFSDREFEGFTGSNIFFGDYTSESEMLIFSKFGISEVLESEWGLKFGDAIFSTYNNSNNNYSMHFTIDGNILKIEYESTQYMHFQKR